jgi:hypothetical protein
MSEQPKTDNTGEGAGAEPGGFAEQASAQNAGLLRELFDLIRHNKKWWLIPVIVALLLIGVIVLLSTTAVAPFIYPLF